LRLPASGPAVAPLGRRADPNPTGGASKVWEALRPPTGAPLTERFFSLMSAKTSPPTDLLGDPWTEPRDPRGRKRHKRTAEIAEKVGLLRAADMTVEDIAARVGLSEPTLRKYYFRELGDGPAVARALVLEAMFDKAKAGNVSAARLMLAEFDKGDTAPPIRPQAAEPAARKEPPLGKKAQADVDAKTAHEDTGWGPLLN
jgi:hypothetical protein